MLGFGRGSASPRRSGTPPKAGRHIPSSLYHPAVFASLAHREMSGNRRAFSKAALSVKFKNFKVLAEFDSDPGDAKHLKIPYIRKRSKVTEIVYANDIIVALCTSGICAAFRRDTLKRVCFLNLTPDEVVRSTFYNKVNDSLITVSVLRADNFASLRCRTTPLAYIRRGEPDNGYALFEEECLMYPGFVEFDDVNSKVLTFSAEKREYKVWDLANYTFLYSIVDKTVFEIKTSPGFLLLIHQRVKTHVQLQILNIEDGVVIKQIQHLLHRQKRIDFIEIFNDTLLIKQGDESLQIVDMRTLSKHEVSQDIFKTPQGFVFLYESKTFLTFRDQVLSVWSAAGEPLAELEDHRLFQNDTTNNICLPNMQDVLISFCMGKDGRGSVNVSEISTGKCIAKLNESHSGGLLTTLNDITALHYCEEKNEIVTGTRDGRLYVWGN